MGRQRSPGLKLLFAGIIGFILLLPLLMVYALVSDREAQSRTAQASITAGWGGAQVMTGPVLVIPYEQRATETVSENGKVRTRDVTQRRELFVSPKRQSVETQLSPEYKKRSIHQSVIYGSQTTGTAAFELPGDLSRMGIARDTLKLDEAELRFGVADPRGLTDGTRVVVSGKTAPLQPGNGPAATSGSGFSAPVTWDGKDALSVKWAYGLKGSKSIALVPRGEETRWKVRSPWPHPSFAGDFLPDPEKTKVSADGFEADYGGITNLALGEALASVSDKAPPSIGYRWDADDIVIPTEEAESGQRAKATVIRLVEPVDLYSQVDRSVKYGFLFIGFTFAAYLMFDLVAGARVAPAEYLLTGAALVLFFVLLLAFAEVIGFAWAYIIASVATIGLLTAYSAAVLGGWRRAGMIGAMLTGLYAVLYVLLNLEAWSLVIGSLLLFVALAAVMYATRHIDWTSVGSDPDDGLDPVPATKGG